MAEGQNARGTSGVSARTRSEEVGEVASEASEWSSIAKKSPESYSDRGWFVAIASVRNDERPVALAVFGLDHSAGFLFDLLVAPFLLGQFLFMLFLTLWC